MVKKIVPSEVVNRPLNLPSSKSVAHRALIILSFSTKHSKLYNVTFNDDVNATIDVLTNLGIKFNKIDSTTLEIDSSNLFIDVKKEFNVLESGTTLRLLLPFLAFLDDEITIYTKGNLINRPLNVYEEIFNKDKLNLEIFKEQNYLKIYQKLDTNTFKIRGDVSSQFVSGLLLYEALIKKSGDLTVLKPFESKSYVDLTVDMLKYFGYEYIVKETETEVLYTLNEKNIQEKFYQEYYVEADLSSLAFLIVLGIINNDLSFNGVNQKSLQADYKVIDIIKKMNGKISFDKESKLIVEKSDLSSIIIDLKECPDLGPILMALVSLMDCQTKFINTKRLAYKESNRALAMKEELEKIGAKVSIMENEIIVQGVKEVPNGQTFDSHNDHRITMSLAIVSTIFKTPSYFKNAECVKKSYPEFFEDLEKLGIGVSNA